MHGVSLVGPSQNMPSLAAEVVYSRGLPEEAVIDRFKCYKSSAELAQRTPMRLSVAPTKDVEA